MPIHLELEDDQLQWLIEACHPKVWPMSVNFILASFNVWRHPGYVAKEGFKLVAYIITV